MSALMFDTGSFLLALQFALRRGVVWLLMGCSPCYVQQLCDTLDPDKMMARRMQTHTGCECVTHGVMIKQFLRSKDPHYNQRRQYGIMLAMQGRISR